MTVTSRRGWFAAVGFTLVSIVTVLWLFFGVIPVRVHAQGILMYSGGVFTVQAPVSGTVVEYLVAEGDQVEAGSAIARLAQPTLEREIELAEEGVKGIELRHEQLARFSGKASELEALTLEKQKDAALTAIASAKAQLNVLRERKTSQQSLLSDGLITKERVDRTQQEIQMQEQSLRNAEALYKSLSLNAMRERATNDREIADSLQNLVEARKRLESLKEQLKSHALVRSPESGKVTELRQNKGSAVGPGMALLNLEVESRVDDALEVMLYVRASDGKKINGKMQALVEPSTVKSQEWGFLVGEITEVGKFPVSADGMHRLLGNEALVNFFLSADPAPVAVRARLNRHNGNASGYEWTTGNGPPLPVTAGTICNAQITVAHRRPISLLFPVRTGAE